MAKGVPARSWAALKIRAERSFAARYLLPVQHFLHTETVSAVFLLAAAVTALLWANSPWAQHYFDFWHRKISFDLGFVGISADLHHWINDALMAVFFFVVGLEIKRELVQGQLSTFRKAVLPAAAALGGMVVPALTYVAFNWGTAAVRGWGVPMATDIAFAVGVLALVGRNCPSEARIFLLALAIVDDIGSIMVIAFFYTEELHFAALLFAMLVLAFILAAQRLGVQSTNIYLFLGVVFWFAVFESGVHATIAGVVLGLITPATAAYSQKRFQSSIEGLLRRYSKAMETEDKEDQEAVLGEVGELTRGTEAPVSRLERIVHPWTSYAILPLFALANSGVTVSAGVLGDAVASPIALGIIAGLVAGKFVGILGFSWLAVKLGIADLPGKLSFGHLAGVAMLGGVGFTVALFIAALAFGSGDQLALAKLGILAASLASGVFGYAIMKLKA